ncbi:MAG TPA: hypothetical protein VFI72_01810 [Candidatus Angelobacter sp.]|nr:hypothetical protein [Candidatus Angelobacter sp.]
MATCRNEHPVDALYLAACVIFWRATGDPKAGWELVCALASPDLRTRCLAASLLRQGSPGLMPVLCTAYVG